MTPQQTHVAIYTRLSRDPLNLRAAVDRQERDSRAIAASRWPDLPVVVYEDNDKSAWSGAKRPAYDALLAAIEARQAVAVVAYDQDRLLRQPRQLESLIDLCEQVRLTNFVTVAGDLDLTGAEGRLRARVNAAVAAKSSDDTSRRIRRMLLDKRERGDWHGRLPYGIVTWEAGAPTLVDDRKAAIVRSAYDRIVAGDSLLSVQRWGNSVDPTAPTSKPGWRKLLMTSPLLDETQRATMHAIFTDPSRVTTRDNRRAYWLSGIMVCDECGSLLRRRERRDSGGIWIWRCCASPDPTTGAPGAHTSAPAIAVERAVELALFTAAEVVMPAPDPIPEPAVIDDEVKARLDTLSQMFVAGDITKDEWLAARDSVIPAAPVATIPRPASVSNLEAEWPNLTVNQRHAATRSLVTEIRLARTERRGRFAFDPSRLVYAWRHPTE